MKTFVTSLLVLFGSSVSFAGPGMHPQTWTCDGRGTVRHMTLVLRRQGPNREAAAAAVMNACHAVKGAIGCHVLQCHP